MALFDTHAHLDDERFGADLPEVLSRAAAAGLEHVIAVATTAPSSRACVDLAARFGPQVRCSIGIQPNHVAEASSTAWDDIVALAGQPSVVAIGETGLDRYWDHTPFPQQEDYFARHLELARRTGRPVIIHCRDAEADVVRMLKRDYEQRGPVRGVMHSFTGSSQTAQACLDMGLYISFAGMLTYKNAQPLRDVAARLPPDRLLVETDCPYLAPVPVRGKRNEPAFLVHTAKCLADAAGVPFEALAEASTRNARALFAVS